MHRPSVRALAILSAIALLGIACTGSGSPTQQPPSGLPSAAHEPPSTSPPPSVEPTPEEATIAQSVMAALADPELTFVASTMPEQSGQHDIAYSTTGSDWSVEWRATGVAERFIAGKAYMRTTGSWVADACVSGEWLPGSFHEAFAGLDGATLLGTSDVDKTTVFEFALSGVDHDRLWRAMGITEPWLSVDDAAFSVMADDAGLLGFTMAATIQRVLGPGGDPAGDPEHWQLTWIVEATGETAAILIGDRLAVPEVARDTILINGLRLDVPKAWLPSQGPESRDGWVSFRTSAGTATLSSETQARAVTVKAYGSHYIAALKKQLHAKSFGKATTERIGGKPARVYVVRYTSEDVPMSGVAAVVVDGRRTYAVLWLGPRWFETVMRDEMLKVLDTASLKT